jgi:hypothetical protein
LHWPKYESGYVVLQVFKLSDPTKRDSESLSNAGKSGIFSSWTLILPIFQQHKNQRFSTC